MPKASLTSKNSESTCGSVHVSLGRKSMKMFTHIVFYLMGWSLLPNALRPFKIYCAPSNFDITRT